jgi:hypothetical protein
MRLAIADLSSHTACILMLVILFNGQGVEQRIREVVVEISEASRQKKMAVAASASRPTAAKRAAILAVSDDEWDPTLEVHGNPCSADSHNRAASTVNQQMLHFI